MIVMHAIPMLSEGVLQAMSFGDRKCSIAALLTNVPESPMCVSASRKAFSRFPPEEFWQSVGLVVRCPSPTLGTCYGKCYCVGEVFCNGSVVTVQRWLAGCNGHA